MSYLMASVLANDPMLSDVEGGYLSDVVPSQHSTGSMDMDLERAAKVLDTHFYKSQPQQNATPLNNRTLNFTPQSLATRNTTQAMGNRADENLAQIYDERFKSLSTTLTALCSELCNDELIQEMKRDKASIVFLPAHVNEVVERCLSNDREVNLQQSLIKLATADRQLEIQRKEIKALKETLASKDRHYKERENSQQQIVDQLQLSLQKKQYEIEQLHKASEKNVNEFKLLEQSFEQNARELASIEDTDKQERIAKQQLLMQLSEMTAERDALREDLLVLRAECTRLQGDHQQWQLLLQQRQVDEESTRKRMHQLMAQVDVLLDEDDSEHAQALAAAQEKMLDLRNRLLAELHKEQRLSSALQEELHVLKGQREEWTREQKALRSEDSQLRDALAQSQANIVALKQQHESLQMKVQQLQLENGEWSHKHAHLQQTLAAHEATAAEQRKLAEDRVLLEAKQQMEHEQRRVDQRAMAFKIHYENELGKLNHQLRGSYVFADNEPSKDRVLASLGTDSNQFQSELAYRNILEQQFSERDRLIASHEQEMSSLRQAMIVEGRKERQMLQQELENKRLMESNELRSMLEEAAQNIDKLKAMVREGRAVVKLQSERIEQLKKENDVLANKLIARPVVSIGSKSSQSPGMSQAARRTASEEANNSVNITQGMQTPVALRQMTNESTATQKLFADSQQTPIAHQADDTSVLRMLPIDEQSHVSQLTDKVSLHTRNSKMSVGVAASVGKSVRIADLASTSSRTSPSLMPRSRSITPQRNAESSPAPSESLQLQLSQRQQQLTEVLASNKAHMQRILLLEHEVQTLQNENQLLRTEYEHLQQRLESTAAAVDLDQSTIASQSHRSVGSTGNGTAIGTSLSNPHDVPSALEADQEHFEVVSERVQTSSSLVEVETCDAAVSATDIPSPEVVELLAHIDRLRFDVQQLQEKLRLQEDISTMHKHDLDQERNRVMQSKTQEGQLRDALLRLESLYKKQLRSLKQQLDQMRGTVLDFTSWTASESYATWNNYKLQLKILVDQWNEKQSQSVKDLRASMATVHQRELTNLEDRFIEQINKLNKKHSKELEKVHQQLLARTEQALNASTSHDFLDAASLRSSLSVGAGEEPTNASSLLSQSLQSLSQSVWRLSDTESKPTADARASTPTAASTKGQRNAFESVLKGVMEGLMDQDCVTIQTANIIQSLATEHQEPSFAATAAARSIVGEEIDKFVLNVIQNKYRE